MPPRPDDMYQPGAAVSPETQAPNDYIRAEATPQDFGAQVGAATQGFGQSVERVGTDLNNNAVLVQQRNDRIAVDKAMGTLQDVNNKLLYGDKSLDPNDPKSRGYLG